MRETFYDLILNPSSRKELRMKVFGFCTLLVAFLLLSFAPSAVSQSSATAQIDPLPVSGTYFIVNADTKEALTPNAASAAQNVFCTEYNQSGMQKWIVTRKIDPKTKKPLNRFTIKLSGENNDLWLQPFPAPGHTCMVSSGASDFTMAPIAGSVQLKNVSLNGDALYAYPTPPAPTEARFGPPSGDAKYRWDFIAAD